MYAASNYYVSTCIYTCINKIKNIYITRIPLYCTCTSSGNFTSTCTYVDDNKNVRIRLKNILFEYTYTVMYLECRFRNPNLNDAILHCIKKHCYSGLIPSHILICASGHQVNLISYREKSEYSTRISYDTGSVF